MKQIPTLIGATLAMLLAACAAARAADNVLYDELTGQGLLVSGGARVKLPAPTLADGLDAAGQRRALAVLEESGFPLSGLTRDVVVAPLVLKLGKQPSPAGGDSTVRQVDLWFVIHSDLKRLNDDTFLKRQFENEVQADGSDTLFTLVELPAETMAAHKFRFDPQHEKFFTAGLTLFDRVRLVGTLHAEQSHTEDSLIMAMVIDPRFADDPAHAGAWQSLKRNAARQPVSGAAQPYLGAGGYVKVTRLHEPAGALLVECHSLFDEPRGWFEGANYLASKLPLVARDSVRKIRRRLRAADSLTAGQGAATLTR